jgi:hypothetical protein
MWLQETSVVCPIAQHDICTEIVNSDVGVLLLYYSFMTRVPQRHALPHLIVSLLFKESANLAHEHHRV